MKGLNRDFALNYSRIKTNYKDCINWCKKDLNIKLTKNSSKFRKLILKNEIIFKP